MSLAYRRLGEEFLVNTITSGVQDQPSITALPSGGFVVVWVDTGSAPAAIRAQLYDADGVRAGGEFLVSTSPVSQGQPDVAALDTGGFIVTWRGVDSNGAGIKGQIFDAQSDPVGGELSINSLEAGSQTRPTVAALRSGGFVATWMDPDGEGGAYNVKAQIFSPNGVKVGGQFLVDTSPVGDQSRPVVTTLTSGEFVIGWFESGGDAAAQGVKAQMFSASGARIGGEFFVNTQLAGSQLTPAITALSTGGFVITWTDDSGIGGDASFGSIKAQIFGADGQKIGGELLVNTSTEFTQDSPTVAALPGGGFVIGWFDGGDELTRIKAQAFGENGDRIGRELSVSTLAGGYQPTISVLASGEFVVSWANTTSLGENGDHGSIRAQIFAPINEITGTSADDSRTGTAGDDLIRGLAGNDDLSGNGGDDILEGGSGADTLDGGLGADEMIGGAGDDRYVVENVGDIAMESVRTAASTRS